MIWEHQSDQKDGFRFDRALQIFGKQFYFEVERGTQEGIDIREKVQQYLAKPGRFYVVFTVQDYQKNPYEPITKTAAQYAKEILPILAQARRNNQFTVAPHLRLVATPLAEVLMSPVVEFYSLETIE
ncbi:MAG: hypothetical protein AB1757_06875 [Acidobacteriota bacterium]